MENPIWFEFSFISNASKNRTYRERVTKQCTSLMNFFVKNSLLTVNPFDENGIIKDNLEIYKNDLTEAGQYLFTSGLFISGLHIQMEGEKSTIINIWKKHLESIKIHSQKEKTVGNSSGRSAHSAVQDRIK